ncbi:RNA-guided endonuclease InsQ/TnpB family protein [Parafrankia elaeagni]|uniref:RNA-guided endonuclease InsQ/TnpB family protein n=1 Tax=Parafrankia elaeagni TaxID=222534 RepID=UPI0003A23608|nr:RNA-guided endonuclease TnpB family protein [Parafrankia elaeagni]
MRRTFKFQLRPTVRQAAAFTAMLNSHRALYNAALQERRDAYRHPSRTTVRYGGQSAQLKEIRGVGHVKVNQHRPVLGTVKTISVKREGCRWYVVLSCDDVPAAPLPVTGAVVGVDLEVASLATTSDGRHIGNPRYLAAVADRLARAQRRLARKKRGSARRRKAVARVAALHGTVRRQRLDLAHKTALGLVREHDLIAVEALRVGNMTRRAAPRPDPDRPGAFLPNGQAAETGLNTSILGARWGVFLCVACEYTAHADVNAAVNILRAGLARQATQAA